MKSKPIEIESLEQWENISDILTKYKYHPWQWQYHADLPEGLHVFFASTGYGDIEIITHSPAVEDAIQHFRKSD